MEKIDIEKLGEEISEWRDGKPWSSHYSQLKANRELAEKINEIVEHLNLIQQ